LVGFKEGPLKGGWLGGILEVNWKVLNYWGLPAKTGFFFKGKGGWKEPINYSLNSFPQGFKEKENPPILISRFQFLP